MENIETMLKLSETNHLLKKMSQQMMFELHKLIQDCLSQTEPKLELEQFVISSKIPPPITTQQLIKNQMSSIAVLLTQCNQSMQTQSQKLIENQLRYEQSKEMELILQKYEQQLLTLRNHLIDKQNKLYYTNRDLYQCYEDSYQNCVPSYEKLVGIEKNNIKRKQLRNNINIFLGELNQLQCIIEGYNKINNGKLEIREEKQEEESQQLEEEVDNQHKDANNKGSQVQSKTSNTRQQNKNRDPIQKLLHQYLQNLNICSPPFDNIFDQSTTVSCKNTQTHHQNNKNNSQQVAVMPNFIQMAQFDYQLFSIYINKVERQTERFEKLMQEYNNYKNVFSIVYEENKKLVNKYHEETKQYQHESIQNTKSLEKQISQGQEQLQKQRKEQVNISILKQIKLQKQQGNDQYQNYRFTSQRILQKNNQVPKDDWLSQPKLDQAFFTNYQNIAKCAHQIQEIDHHYKNQKNWQEVF